MSPVRVMIVVAIGVGLALLRTAVVEASSPGTLYLPLAVRSHVPELRLIDQFGGVGRAVVLAGDRAYVAAGIRVYEYDLSDPASPRRIRHTEMLPAPARALAAARGSVYAVLDGESVLVTIGTEPGEHLPVSTGATASSTTADVVVVGDSVVVCGEHGLDVFHADEADALTPVGSLSIQGGLDRCAAAGNHTVVGINQENLHVVDVSQPNQLASGTHVHGTSWTTGGSFVDLAVVQTSSTSDAAIEFAYTAVVLRSLGESYTSKSFRLGTVTLPQPGAAPVLGDRPAGQYRIDSPVRIAGASGWAYVTGRDAVTRLPGIAAHRIPADRASRLPGVIPLPHEPAAVHAAGDYLTVAGDGLSVHDIREPAHPVETGADASLPIADDLAVTDKTVATLRRGYGGRLMAFSANDLSGRNATSELTFTDSQYVSAVAGNGATLVVATHHGLDLVHISRERTMTVTATLSPTHLWSGHRLQYMGAVLNPSGTHVLASGESPEFGADVVQLSSASVVGHIKAHTGNGSSYFGFTQFWWSWSDRHVAVSYLYYCRSGGRGGFEYTPRLRLFDVRDNAAPRDLADVTLQDRRHHGPTVVQGDRLWMRSLAYWPDQRTLLVAFDITDPSEPVERFTVTLDHSSEQMAISGDRLVLLGRRRETDRLRSLFVYDVSSTGPPRLAAEAVLPQGTGRLAVRGSDVWVAAAEGGVYRFALR